MVEEIRNIRSIQVFLTAYNTRNVTRAAGELRISQSSISYHIKKLEDDLSVLLFRRGANGLTPTEEGRRLAQYVERGLGSIRMGLELVAKKPTEVKIALLPMFASRWFSSRLGGFLEDNPQVQLSIQTHNNAYAHMEHPEQLGDIGIQWGLGNWENFHVTRLWREELVIVCSPDYLAAHDIAEPSDLRHCTLLHVDDTRMWDEWFDNHGLQRAQEQAEMMLEDRHFQLSSTINGLGVSLFAAWLVEAELASGVLVNPFGRSFQTAFAYHVIAPRDGALAQSAVKLVDWLAKEARDTRGGGHQSDEA